MLFVVGTVTALFGPILIEMIADRYTVTRTALLGRSGHKQRRKCAPADLLHAFRSVGSVWLAQEQEQEPQKRRGA